MVIGKKHRSSDVPHVGKATHRPVCYQGNLQIANLRASRHGPTSICHGRTISRLEGNVSVHVSPTSTVAQSDTTNTTDANVPTQFGDALLAAASMVPTRRKPRNRAAVGNSVRTVPPVTDSGQRQKGVPSKPASSQVTRVEHIEKSVRRKGFSKAVASRISTRSKCSSTSTVYNQRWALFSSWCKEHKRDPKSCSIARVADFLLYLFQKRGLSTGSILGYKAVIASTWNSLGNDSLTHNSSIKSLLRSFQLERPKPLNLVPKWDLSIVLDALRKAPFEPLQSATIGNVTAKVFFLLALATGKRRSELHALVYEGSGLKVDKSAFILRVDLAFLSKTDRLKHVSSSTFELPALPSPEKEERMLCPVRALSIYLDRTEEFRKHSGAKKLLVSCFPKHVGDISAQTVSRHIRDAVPLAYMAASKDLELRHLHNVKAHDLRALSASLALKRSVALEDILAAANWKTQSTFSSHYLRDLSYLSADLYRLGPLVAAGKVVQS